MTETSPGRWAVLGRILVIYCIFMSLAVDYVLLFPQPPHDAYRPDFGVYWVVAGMLGDSPGQIYDGHAVTEALGFLAGSEWGLLPWVNPPTALLAVVPLAALPFWWALAVWVAIGSLAYAGAVARFARGRAAMLLLILVSFPFVNAAYAGQIALFVATFGIAAVLCLDDRPVLAGLLITLAGILKPSMLVFAPVALAAGGHWRAFAAAAVATLAAGAVTTLAFGAERWLEWYEAISGFAAVLEGRGIVERVVTLNIAIQSLGLPGGVELALRVAGGLLGLVLCALIFRRTADPGARLVGLYGTALFASPYAMGYDLMVMLPVAAWVMLRDKRGPIDWWLALAGFGLFFPIAPIGAFVAAIFTVSVALAVLSGRVPAVTPVPARRD